VREQNSLSTVEHREAVRCCSARRPLAFLQIRRTLCDRLPDRPTFDGTTIERNTHMKVRTLLSAVTALGLTAGAWAQEKVLGVGDQAPGLDIELWTRGEET